MDKYLKVETKFTKNGYKYELITRTDFTDNNVAIYKQSGENANDTYFEVVILKNQEEKVVVIDNNPIHYEAKEHYPSSEEWGLNGFTLRSYTQAQVKFYELVNEMNLKNKTIKTK